MNPAQQLLSRVRVVLARPSHPGNIGACARAMKTMGLTRLYLVNPLKFPHQDAITMAAHSLDVLDNAIVCDSLEDALAGTVFTVASTARPRGIEHEVLNAREAGGELARHACEGYVALLMGTEKFGLSNEEISRCNLIGLIPCDPEFSSLNLASAVQVFAYEIRQGVLSIETPAAEQEGGRVQERLGGPVEDTMNHKADAATDASMEGGLAGHPEARLAERLAAQRRAQAGDTAGDPPATHQEVEHLLRHWERVLYQIDFLNDRHPKKIMYRLRRFMARARPEKKEVRILRGILTEVQKSLKPEALARPIPDRVAAQPADLDKEKLD